MKFLITFIILLGCSSKNIRDYIEVNMERENPKDLIRLSYELPYKTKIAVLNDFDPKDLKSIELLNSNLKLRVFKNKVYFISTKQNIRFKQIVIIFKLPPKIKSSIVYPMHKKEMLLNLPSFKLDIVDGELEDGNRENVKNKFNFISDKFSHLYFEKKYIQIDQLETNLETSAEFLFWGESKTFHSSQIIISEKFRQSTQRQLNEMNNNVLSLISKQLEISPKVFPFVYITAGRNHSFSQFERSIVYEFNSRLNSKSKKEKYSNLIDSYLKFFFKKEYSESRVVNDFLSDYIEYEKNKFMLELGVIKQSEYMEQLSYKANQCLLKYVGEKDIHAKSCTRIKSLILSHDLKKSLLTFLYQAKLQKISKDDFNEELIEFLENKSKTQFSSLNEFLNLQFDKQGQELKKHFDRVGIKYSQLSSNLLSKKLLAKLLVQQLYLKNCYQEDGVELHSRTVFVKKNSKCEGFNKNFYIYSVNSFHIFKQVQKAYEYTRLSCLTKGEVHFKSISGKTLKVNCYNLAGPFELVELQ